MKSAFRVYKFLYRNECKSLSNDARVLYAFLEKKSRVNKKKERYNENGKTFVIYPRENLSQQLLITERVVSKCMKHLRKLDLIIEKKQGRGLPNKIYVVMPLQEK